MANWQVLTDDSNFLRPSTPASFNPLSSISGSSPYKWISVTGTSAGFICSISDQGVKKESIYRSLDDEWIPQIDE
jgi:hypothetical protein